MDHLGDQLVPGSADFATRLRIAKRRVAFLTAYKDLTNQWSLETVTGVLSQLADLSLERSLAHVFLETSGAEGLPAHRGLCVLAMGKHGANELNYSSDIDLIVMFDDGLYDPDEVSAHRRTLIRATQKIVKLLSEQTVDGYVFRTDLRLRPDAAVTPVCISFDAAERYYESLGRTWERAAMIKARPAAGDLDSGHEFLGRLTPFVWRRNLDFAAIRDAEDMLHKIRQTKGLMGKISVPGHDIKLGRGGIREIEFFAQTHQLIFGGRDASVRSSRTVSALKSLAATGRIEEDRAARLIDNYRFLRTLEHRLQMLDDAQTHAIPSSDDKLERIAAFCGLDSVEAFTKVVSDRLEDTHSLTELQTTRSPTPPATPELDAELHKLEEDWYKLPALRAERGQASFQDIRPQLLARFDRSPEPNDALMQFDRFIKALPSGVQLFSLFASNQHLLDLVVDICCVSPALADYLGNNAQILDVVLDGGFFDTLPDSEWYLGDLQQKLTQARDYEDTLDLLRIWQKEQHFRVGVHLLKNLSDLSQVAAAYSAIAEVSVRCLVPYVEAHLEGRYGKIEGAGAAIIAMGKLGSREMTAESDLDLIFVYDAPADAESDGRKALPASTYYSRFTQTMISALTVPTSQGHLYEVDMRLRPSGRQGPVATSLSAFESYQHNSAWTWEHLALTRSRTIAGSDELQAELTRVISDVLQSPHDQKTTLKDVSDMRARLSAAKSETDDDQMQTKHGAGRLMDAELLVQAGALIKDLSPALGFKGQVNALVEAGWLSHDDGENLCNSWSIHVAVQHAERLIGAQFSTSGQNSVRDDFLLHLTEQTDTTTLWQTMADYAERTERIVESKLAQD